MRKQMRLGGIMVLLLLQVGALMAQFEATKPLPTDPNVKIGKLANGLTYYIHKNALPAKKFSCGLW